MTTDDRVNEDSALENMVLEMCWDGLADAAVEDERPVLSALEAGGFMGQMGGQWLLTVSGRARVSQAHGAVDGRATALLAVSSEAPSSAPPVVAPQPELSIGDVFPDDKPEPKDGDEPEGGGEDDDREGTAAYHLQRNAATMRRIDSDVKKRRLQWFFIREESLASSMDEDGSADEGLLTMQDAAALYFKKPIGHPVKFNVNEQKRRLYAVWNGEGLPGPDDEPEW